MPCQEAIEMLHDASFLKKNYFMCFAKYYWGLYKLQFIDDDSRVTPLGKQFLRHCLTEGYIK